jgi:hypothetical protein
MIKLNFEIIPRYVAYHAVVNCAPRRFVSGAPDQKIVSFQNAAWSEDRAAYEFLRYGFSEINLLGSPSVGEIAQRAERLLETMVRDATFAPLLSETTSSLELVKSEWESNCVKTHEMVSTMTGLELKGNFRIFLTHPALKQGHYHHELKAVCWAHRNTWPNYNTVYLWHELLHGFIPGANLEHAVIQLIADNEMRIRLNGDSYPPFEGHPYLTKMMEILLPYWRQYIDAKEKDICGFIAKMAALAEIKEQLAKCAQHKDDD